MVHKRSWAPSGFWTRIFQIWVLKNIWASEADHTLILFWTKSYVNKKKLFSKSFTFLRSWNTNVLSRNASTMWTSKLPLWESTMPSSTWVCVIYSTCIMQNRNKQLPVKAFFKVLLSKFSNQRIIKVRLKASLCTFLKSYSDTTELCTCFHHVINQTKYRGWILIFCNQLFE